MISKNTLRFFTTALTLFFLQKAFSASFDCSNTHIFVESLICSNSQLSVLDERLSESFKGALASANDKKNLMREQRDWLNLKRNRCSTASCLALAYSSRIAALDKRKIANASSCPIEERSLLGHWRAFDTAAEFEEISFQLKDGDHVFLSWRNDHPEMLGRWELRDCEINVIDPNVEPLAFHFKVNKYINGALYLEDTDNGGSISKFKKRREAGALFR